MLDSAVLEPVGSHSHALAISGGDPWVRWSLPSDPAPRMWRSEFALAVEREGGRRHSLTVIPLPGAPDPEAAVEGVIAEAVHSGLVGELGVLGISVPQAHIGALERQVRVDGGGDWEWMWTLTAPAPLAVEADLLHLDDTDDAAEILQLSTDHSPTAEGEPGTGLSEVWIGARAPEGALIAAGAMQRLPSGVPYLAGIVVHTAHRGRGLGAAVTAALTRVGLDEAGVCTLSMYSDNPVARRAYHRLSYRTAWAWASRSLAAGAV
ncbi:GNAT family N-acetyltransferase [Pseudactinotalea sp. Z1748]|uniref:GNAT family N-acetyltransferase n=1 Tax=Pseudactinotalea sp. Z1748 TaxID=3413027 RepID=UPI003C798B70